MLLASCLLQILDEPKWPVVDAAPSFSKTGEWLLLKKVWACSAALCPSYLLKGFIPSALQASHYLLELAAADNGQARPTGSGHASRHAAGRHHAAHTTQNSPPPPPLPPIPQWATSAWMTGAWPRGWLP